MFETFNASQMSSQAMLAVAIDPPVSLVVVILAFPVVVMVSVIMLCRAIRRRSQQSEMADAIYSRLSSESVSAAHLVRELRSRWGVKRGVGSVHGFVREVATCLLHHDDVEVGDVTAGRFVPWQLASWEADERIEAELMDMDLFLDDESKYVFRKKPVA